MKSPLWMVNAIFALFLCLLFVLMLILKKPIIKRTSISPQEPATPLAQEVSKINPVRIYESDLFRTFVRAQPLQQEVAVEDQPIVPPAPPLPKTFVKKQRAMPEFLAPLEVELKGIIYNSNSVYSRAIIMDRKTKQEKLHKIGDTLEDAHLIFIGKNKAMFIRSNGQQETLFVSAEAAQKDPMYAPHNVSTAVERIDEHDFIVNADQFLKEVNNVAQFLDNLDITTAFDKGQIIGCRVGKMLPKSIGPALGLQYADIITSVNGVPATDTSSRVKIYKQIEQAENNQQISAVIQRGGAQLTMNYALQKEPPKKPFTDAYKMLPAGTPLPPEAQHMMRGNKKAAEVTEQTLGQAQTNNGVADIFKKNDKKAMLDYGGRNTLLQR